LFAEGNVVRDCDPALRFGAFAEASRAHRQTLLTGLRECFDKTVAPRGRARASYRAIAAAGKRFVERDLSLASKPIFERGGDGTALAQHAVSGQIAVRRVCALQEKR